MNLSQRVLSLQPSATMAINAKAQEMRAQGRKVISLAVGEPDFNTPDHIIKAAKQALDEGFVRYTPVPGIPELRDAVGGYFSRFYQVNPEREEVIVSNGGKHCLYNLFQCLLDPGDEVLIPAPYWVSYPAMVQLAQGVPVFVPTEAEDNFLVSVDELDKAATDKTKAIIINTPSNPTGCHYTQEQLNELAAWAKSKDIFIISDEIYDQLVYEPAKPASLAGFWAENKDRAAIVNGLSKSMAMTGWRVGFCLAHKDLIKAMTKIQGQSTSNICSIAQKGALAGLTGSFEAVEKMRQSFLTRRDMALKIVLSWPDIVCPKPDGAFYLFPRVDAVYNDKVKNSTELCQIILEEAEVALVPGAAFGDDRCIRISYALDEETLTDALNRIGEVIKRLRR
ncbi:pyridoxal phosphate-dependent aminotransferase [Desulfovulcanus sp.]